ncbi:MAG: hypothetical protein ACC628_23965, partial [Pirellulaceae bacterium]
IAASPTSIHSGLKILGQVTAADFFTLEVLTRAGLIRYFVLFSIDLKTRRVQIAGIAPQPDGERMKQITP